MQPNSAWTYGPNGLPVEDSGLNGHGTTVEFVSPASSISPIADRSLHSEPTLVLPVVEIARPRKHRWLRRLGLAVLLVVCLCVGSVATFWFDPPALGWVGQPFFTSVPGAVPWNGRDPINVLALGEDQRVPGAKTQSDTIIVMQINPGTGKVRLVSLPRDLAVSIPAYQDFTKINEGNYLGGPRYEAYTIEHALGIPINYYVVLRFQTFKRVIDAFGGVNINVDQKIDDPTYPALTGSGFAPLVLNPGMQHMDGATALAYVRERHAYTSGDEVRVQHQQQLISALKTQALSFGTLFRLPSIFDAFRQAFQTNLPANMLPVVFMEMVKNGTMEHVYFSDTNDMVTNCVGYDNGADLCPTPALQPYVNGLFHNQSLADENATVFVQNGTQLPDEAGAIGTTLTTCHFNVVGTGAADTSDHAHTAVIINSAEPAAPYTTRLLQQMFQARVMTQSMPDVHAQIVLLVGNDVPQIQK
jgi:LCP family protein required for cell wall assembly